jgi:GNAT superfamily N-acetyltransferase
MGVRVATSDDIPAMHHIRLSVRENVLSDPSKVQPSDYVAFLTEKGRGWVYELNDSIVGFAIADATTRNLWALFVSREFERQGIGRTLHDTMIQWLFLNDKRPLWLGTQTQSRAAKFYQSAGWRRVGTQPNGEERYEMQCAEY